MNIARKPYIFVIFQGGPDPLFPPPSGPAHALVVYIRGAFIIYCNCYRNSHAMCEIPMKSNTGNSSIFYLSMDTSIVPIGALVFVLYALEVRSFI